jgi:hypothetical protein
MMASHIDYLQINTTIAENFGPFHLLHRKLEHFPEHVCIPRLTKTVLKFTLTYCSSQGVPRKKRKQLTLKCKRIKEDGKFHSFPKKNIDINLDYPCNKLRHIHVDVSRSLNMLMRKKHSLHN